MIGTLLRWYTATVIEHMCFNSFELVWDFTFLLEKVDCTAILSSH